VEPVGSVLNGGAPCPHKTEGIGMDYVYPTVDLTLADAIYTISDEEAFGWVKELALREGVLVGSSSGAAFAGALKEAAIAAPGTNILVIFADSSERYLSKKIYQGGI
jgi:cystathionine beta-synthase (O-acetyl-L-serine)